MRTKENVLVLPQVTILIHNLIKYTFNRWGVEKLFWGKMKLNEPGRQKLEIEARTRSLPY